MKLDWDEIKYQWNDLRYRPEVKRRVLTGAAAGVIVLVIGAFLWSVLSGGEVAKPAARGSAPARGDPLPAPSYRGAKEFAEELQRELAGDARFAAVAVVPTVSGPGGESGRVVLMGQLTEGDLAELRAVVGRMQAPVKVEWRVTRLSARGG